MSVDMLYEGGQMLALVISILFTMLWARHYGVGRLKAFAITVTSQLLCFVLVFVLTWVENGFRNFGEQNAVRAYPFIILLGVLEAKLFRVDFLRVIDFQAVSVPLS